MRLIIYGAGGIGCVIGGHLARTGQETVLIGRPGNVDAINKNGLTLITPTGTHNLKVPAVTGPEQVEFTENDAILLCMKGQNTEEAMQDLQKVVGDVPVFCHQNGVRNEEIVSKYFPRVYAVMVRVGAVYIKDGEVTARRDPPGWFIMSKYPTGIDGTLETVAEQLRQASFLVKVTDDAMPYKWGKLMGNLANSIDAITDAYPPGLTREIHRAAQKELTDLAEEAGIRIISHEETEKEWPDITAPLKGSMETRERSSTWQSLARGQGTVETELLNGEVVRLAKRLGKEAPINEGLVRITQEMADNYEKPGKYTPDQLAEMLGI